MSNAILGLRLTEGTCDFLGVCGEPAMPDSNGVQLYVGDVVRVCDGTKLEVTGLRVVCKKAMCNGIYGLGLNTLLDDFFVAGIAGTEMSYAPAWRIFKENSFKSIQAGEQIDNIRYEEVIYQSGCNRWANRGEHEDEAVGTATAMHECGDCERLLRCSLKQLFPVFPCTPEIAAKMDEDWKKMIQEEQGSYEI